MMPDAKEGAAVRLTAYQRRTLEAMRLTLWMIPCAGTRDRMMVARGLAEMGLCKERKHAHEDDRRSFELTNLGRAALARKDGS